MLLLGIAEKYSKAEINASKFVKPENDEIIVIGSGRRKPEQKEEEKKRPDTEISPRFIQESKLYNPIIFRT